jgi:hypothetical protein
LTLTFENVEAQDAHEQLSVVLKKLSGKDQEAKDLAAQLSGMPVSVGLFCLYTRSLLPI